MRILVFNSDLSGLNKYLIAQLKMRGWNLIVLNMPPLIILKLIALLISFSPNFTKWRNRTSVCLDKLHKSAWAFRKKSQFCQNKSKKLETEIDLILQFSGMFMPALKLDELKQPYVIYTDYTMNLAEKYPPWTPFILQKKPWKDLETQLYLKARLIFTSSENTKKSMIKDYGVDKDKVVSVGCGLTFDLPLISSKRFDTNMIFFLGLDFERKGGQILLEAFRKVRKVFPDVKLAIAGPARNKLKIYEPGVAVVGRIYNRDKLRDLFQDACIFVLPSLCEPFGLVFLEAMAYKLPCIGTTIDAIPEIISNGQTGFLVEPNNVDNLTEKILTLLKDKELARQMGEAGFRRLLERFNWDKVGERVDLELRKIVNS